MRSNAVAPAILNEFNRINAQIKLRLNCSKNPQMNENVRDMLHFFYNLFTLLQGTFGKINFLIYL